MNRCSIINLIIYLLGCCTVITSSIIYYYYIIDLIEYVILISVSLLICTIIGTIECVLYTQRIQQNIINQQVTFDIINTIQLSTNT